MTRRQNSLLIVAAAVAGMVITVGCGSQEISTAGIPLDMEESSTRSETAIVSVAHPTESVSPAINHQPLAEDASPESVCRRFLEHLNREDVDEYEILLTPAAMTVANRLDFHLPPVADADGRFELSEPMFSTNREKLCYIDSKFTSGQPDQTSITWMLRNTKSGWRMAGMLVTGSEPETQNLLSFENMTDINQIKASLIEDVSSKLISD